MILQSSGAPIFRPPPRVHPPSEARRALARSLSACAVRACEPVPEAPFMALLDTLVRSGDWLFVRRSYLPVALFAPVLLELGTSHAAALRALSPPWWALCFGISTLGLLIRVLAVGHAPAGTSGRNTHGQVAEVINTTGLYSLVRHPLYVGNTLMWLGPALLPGSWLLAALVLVLVMLFYERIMAAEEAYLDARFGDAFRAWASTTPAVWPFPLARRGGGASRWVTPALPFSWRTAARREYSGLLGMIATFAVLELVARLVATGRPGLSREGTAILVAGTLVYLVLRTLKRHTRVLHVAGR